jgi:hypothetical protein
MLKVFLKIPGVSRPHAIVGNMLFEDERYLVITQDVIRRKILWDNILYIEEIIAIDANDLNYGEKSSTNSIPMSVKTTAQASKQLCSITVAFTGALNRLFTINEVDQELISHSKWTPELAKLVFTNPEIKTILGSFIVKDIAIDGQNITIITESDKKVDNIADMQSKIDMVKQFSSVANKLNTPRTGRPSMRLPTDFSMSMSPFDSPVPLSDSYSDKESEHVSYREEETISEVENKS